MTQFDIKKMLAGYDKKNLTIATVCSHSSLQIFNGARKEGFKTLGISVGEEKRFYDAFPLGRPDEFFIVDSYKDISRYASELQEKNVIVIPHGSFVEYLGAKNFLKLNLPTFGNRKVLLWESDRKRERQWLESAGLTMPREIKDPTKIDKPVIVKYHGAKGGKGFFIAKTYDEFIKRVDKDKPYIIQEFVMGTRYYLHYFYSPIQNNAYKLSKGSLQLLSMDRRDETTIDEVQRLGSIAELEEIGIHPTFVVTGNIPIVMRESLLPEVFRMGAAVVEKSLELFGGVIGSFCLETVVTEELKFKVFEISARIVAGTNPYISGSPYSELIQPDLSTGRRIAQEIKYANKRGLLHEILS
ncbi:MAG: 5-formaminoimidazole-4-carboxamide-1-(beta)-D-ribofuranosyl 5'-monophosphate synthetase [Thermoplasmata archaeon]|nr:MAG: 5-formaminoimidazole-4-carboxamide-1-(beta)-D-ribofuranosyl 5'-monophosphate synthetase [Thermoplasmata archaeon]RLF34464.1 MAG: 5-formaminoimidazole-4-carboxamide-1-(beta)-D-ribofuranosyl 5'-monophosphate synthetase [Thermoplasmata archaeon]